MKALMTACMTLLFLSGCIGNRPPDPQYREVRCKQLLQRTEYPPLREIQRMQARTEAAQLGCFR